jgi:hypothetical protein
MRLQVRAFRLATGRRGLVLILFGIIYGLIGLSYTAGALSPTAAQNLHLALQLLPIHTWGVLWLVAGGLALVASHWPPGRDWWGYAVLSGLSTTWCVVSLLGRLLYGAPYGLSGALVYGCLSAALLIIAGWPEVR